MTHLQARTIATLFLLLGGSLLAYLLWQTPPRHSDGQLDLLAVAAFLLALLFAITALGGFGALLLHQRWPILSGIRRKNNLGNGERGQVALRQGLLLAVICCVTALFAILQILDWLLVLLVVIIMFLFEAYLQSREH